MSRRLISLHLAPETHDALVRAGVPKHAPVGRTINTAFERLDRLSQLASVEVKLGRGFYEFALELLTDPWSLSASDIQALPTVLRTKPGATPLAHARGFDLADFVAAIEALRYADRLALVDRAQQHHALNAP